MNHLTPSVDGSLVDIRNARAASSIVLICEHASAHIPDKFRNLGLADQELDSHVVWDPGAMALAVKMADRLNVLLIAAKTSRLVYDCNRPPDAPDAIPVRSEIVEVPGNASLSAAEKAERIDKFYRPFRKAVSDVISRKTDPIVVTIHSFTPIYYGQPREVEIGVLHDSDTRLADAILTHEGLQNHYVVRRNEPYGPSDGVTHTLKEHALPGGHLNVMLEVRNDLIADAAAQTAIADRLSDCLTSALARMEVDACRT